MSAQLDSPVIAPDQAAAPAQQKQTFAEIVRAQYAAEEPVMQSLAAKYKGVAFDCATTKGLDAAKAARLELREQGRFKLQRAADATKAEANDLKRVIDAESARLIAIVKPVEDEVHSQITAEEDRKAAEKAERERLAAELKAHHDGKIATIRACADRARGLPSDRITNGITQVEALAFGQDCADFLAQYETAKTETLTTMRALLAEAQAREAADAQRLENERVAAELAAQRAALEAEAAELKRQAAEVEAARLTAEATRTQAENGQAAAERESLVSVDTVARPVFGQSEEFGIAVLDAAVPDHAQTERTTLAQTQAEIVKGTELACGIPLETERAMDEARAVMASTSDVRTAPMGLPATSEPATLKLGTIGERLGFTLTEAFVSEVLGIQPSGKEKRAVMFKESDFPRICDALSRHVLKAKAGELLAA